MPRKRNIKKNYILGLFFNSKLFTSHSQSLSFKTLFESCLPNQVIDSNLQFSGKLETFFGVSPNFFFSTHRNKITTVFICMHRGNLLRAYPGTSEFLQVVRVNVQSDWSVVRLIIQLGDIREIFAHQLRRYNQKPLTHSNRYFPVN